MPRLGYEHLRMNGWRPVKPFSAVNWCGDGHAPDAARRAGTGIGGYVGSPSELKPPTIPSPVALRYV